MNKLVTGLLVAGGVAAGAGYLVTTEIGSKQIFRTLTAPTEYYIPQKITIDGKNVAIDKAQNITVPFSHIPDELLDALIATEDKIFRENSSAMNQKSLFRKATGGAGFSGIATQVAKRHLEKQGITTSGKSKLQQLVYAQQKLLDNPDLGATQQERKQKIIEMYVNETKSRPGGNTLGYLCKRARGIDLQANKEDLEPRQAAILVAGLKGSTIYNAFSTNPVNYKNVVRKEQGKIVGRGVQVLKNMLDAGHLTPDQYEQQKQKLFEHVPVKRRFTANELKEFDMRVEQAYTKEAQSYAHEKATSIELTLNKQKQADATNIINVRVHIINDQDIALRGSGAEGYGIGVTQDGKIERYVPGVNQSVNSVDMLTNAQIYPGSMIKPIFVAFLLQRGYITSSMTFSNKPQQITARGPDGYPETRTWTNATGKYSDRESITSILRNSLNCGIADMVVQVSHKAGGTDALLEEFNAFVTGITGAKLGMSPDNFIGQGGMHMTPIQLVKLYLMLANDGKEQNNIRFVEYRTTQDGTKKSTEKEPGKRHVDAKIAQLVLTMIAENSFGGSRKTGTVTNNSAAGVIAITKDKKVILVGYLFPQPNSDPYRKVSKKLEEAGVEKDSIPAYIQYARDNKTPIIYILDGMLVTKEQAMDWMADMSTNETILLPNAHKIIVPLGRLESTSSEHARPMITYILRDVEGNLYIRVQERSQIPPYQYDDTELIIIDETTGQTSGSTISFEKAQKMYNDTQQKKEHNRNLAHHGKHPDTYKKTLQSTKDKKTNKRS